MPQKATSLKIIARMTKILLALLLQRWPALLNATPQEVNDIAPQRSETPDYRMDDEDLFSVAAATLGGPVGCHNKEVHGIAPQRHEPEGYRSASMTGLRQCVKN